MQLQTILSLRGGVVLQKDLIVIFHPYELDRVPVLAYISHSIEEYDSMLFMLFFTQRIARYAPFHTKINMIEGGFVVFASYCAESGPLVVGAVFFVLFIERLQVGGLNSAIGVASDAFEKLQIFVAFMCKGFCGESRFLADEPVIYFFVFRFNGLTVKCCAYSWLFLIGGRDYLCVINGTRSRYFLLGMALQRTYVGVLFHRSFTLVRIILVISRSLALSSSLLCTKRLTTGSSLFMLQLLIAKFILCSFTEPLPPTNKNYFGLSHPIIVIFMSDDSRPTRTNASRMAQLTQQYSQRKEEFLNRVKALQDHVEMVLADGYYVGQVNEQKMRHGKGFFKYPIGDVYFGAWRDDFFHGQGIYLFASGEIYEGLLKNGMKDGHGIYYYDGGRACYDGDWGNDEKHGYGVFDSEEEHYEGQWEMGKKVGNGHLLDRRSGDAYIGSFAHNRKNGQGRVIYADGSVYSGNFWNDLPHGEGNLEFVNKDRYKGRFREGEKEGTGTYYFSEGTVFEGQWHKNLKAEGELTLFNGDVFRGEFKNNERSEGVYTYKNGDVYEGMWEHDVKHGKGKLVLSNGESYQGDFFEGQKHGEGVYRWKSGDVYSGSFLKDRRQGLGMYKWSDGGYYRGQWRSDRMNGWGRLVKDGSTILGQFFADQLIREVQGNALRQNSEIYNFIFGS